MIVLKFGGTSVGSGDRVAAVARLVATRKREELVVVVSALSGVTDELIALSSAARSANIDAIDRTLSRLRERHRRAAVEAGIGAIDARPLLDEIEATVTRASDLARGVALTREQTARTSDARPAGRPRADPRRRPRS